MEGFRRGIKESQALREVALCWGLEEAVFCVGGCDSGLLGAFLGCFGAADGGGAGGVWFGGCVELFAWWCSGYSCSWGLVVILVGGGDGEAS